MRITDVMIDRFGVWKDLLLPVNARGLTAIYGPNEAGKSTLMRFIRGVLYGFPAVPRDYSLTVDHREMMGGSLRVTDSRHTYEISRRIDEQHRETLHIKAGKRALSQSEFEHQLQGIDAETYRTIYTLGLKELRELATLQTDQVGEHIYGSSLGAIGQQLLKAEESTRSHANFLANQENQTGILFDLSGQYRSTHQALGRTDSKLEEYQRLVDDCRQHQTTQDERQRRLQQLKGERANFQYLQRIWAPWKRQQELRAELRSLPDRSRLPQDGLARLTKLDNQHREQLRTVKSLRQEREALKQSLTGFREQAHLRDHASGAQALIDLRSLVESTERHLADATADSTMLKADLDEKLMQLGHDWTINRLAEVDTSPQAHLQLTTVARNYQSSISRRARHRRKYKKNSDTNHYRQTEFQDRLKREKIQSIDAAIQRAETRLGELEQLAQLRVQEAEYEQRIQSAKSQIDKQSFGPELPWWANTMFTLFAMAGGFFVIAGLIKGVQEGWLIGLIYLLTGVMGGALTWALRRHYESNDHTIIRKLRSELEACERKLAEIRDQISRLTGLSFHQKFASPLTPTANKDFEASLIRQASHRLVELQGMAREQERLQRMRKKLSVQRGKLAEFQKEVSQTRQAWCDLLKKIGIRETVRTHEAFQNWQHAVDAQQTLTQWQASKEDVRRHQELLRQLREKMELISERMSLQADSNQPLSETLMRWETLLEEFERSHSTYLSQKRDYRDLTKRYRSAVAKQRRLKQEMTKLLNSVGAETHDQFREMYQKFQRSDEVHALLADLDDQLNSLSREEPELAIAEEDLASFDKAATAERIEMLGLEIEDLELDIAQAQEDLGKKRQALANLEDDTAQDDLRYQRAGILDRAGFAMRDFQASNIAANTLRRMTSEFEQKFQPETLARASMYLDRLTLGRYSQVQTPVGSRELLIRERSGDLRAVADLSDGTREQLLLAIRMGLIDVFAEDGVEMPIILDDIFVNFDQERTEAAVETILKFAESRQVLFFTCHQHLAQLFEAQDVEPIWLPSLAATATKLAG